MTDDLKIYQKWSDAAINSYKMIDTKYPKHQKFILANQTREAILKVGALIDKTNNTADMKTKYMLADQIDYYLSSVKANFKLAWGFKYIDNKTYMRQVALYIELGRMLGGWKKSWKPTQYRQ